MSRSQVEARRWFIKGRVQGVGFRWFAQERGQALGLKGYTRNLDDGRVEVYALGAVSALDDLEGELWKGPRMSEVRGVDRAEAVAEKVSGFRIER